MRNRRWHAGASAVVLALFAASCTAVLGIDKDYHLDGDGGTAGSSTTTATGGTTSTTNTGGTGGTTNTGGTTSTTDTGGTGGTGGTTNTGGTGGTTDLCGDGSINIGEQCDDGGESATCDADCTAVTCGDGTLNAAAGEECDDAGESATCDADCTVVTCGDGTLNAAAGEECDDGNTSDEDVCSAKCVSREVLSVAAGSSHTCALLWGGRVKCWGRNAEGELGRGNTMTVGVLPGQMGPALPFVDLGQGVRAVALAAGFYHTCAILTDGGVKCWGWNAQGQLGLGDTTNRGDKAGQMGDALPAVSLGTGLTAKSIDTGFGHTCAILSNDTVKCWGYNASGNLGLGDMLNRGGKPGEMGDQLPAINFGAGQTATALAAGANHTCALLTGGVKCWGYNNNGELGLGDNANRGDDLGEMNVNLPFVSLGATATALGAGTSHTCAILSNATVKCWGFNSTGQLGIADNQSRGDQPGEMGAALPTVDLGPGVTVPVAITGGGGFSCATRTDQRVKCWGDPAFGQTGGSQPVELGAGQTATAIVSGSYHTCALLTNRLKCWGGNGEGALGLGDGMDRGDSQAEMGDALPFVKLVDDLW